MVKNSIYESGFVNRTFNITIPSENAIKIELSLSFSALNSAHLVTPVWWVCRTETNGLQIDNDFSWSELLLFI